MFNSLTDNVISQKDSNLLYAEMYESFASNIESIQKAKALTEAIVGLENLKGVVAVYGFSESLMTFVNKDGSLSRIAPSIPSLESYLSGVDVSKEISVESLTDTIKKAVLKFRDAFAAHIIKYRKFYTIVFAVINTLNAAGLVILTTMSIISGMPLSILLPSLADYLIKTIPFLNMQIVIYSIKSIPYAIKESLEVPLPTNASEMTEYKNKVEAIFKKHTKNGIHAFDDSFIKDKENSDKKSLKDLGYTVENLKELATELKSAIADLGRGDYIANKLEELSKSSAMETAEGREALLWITEIVTKAMKLVVRSAKESSAELKTITTGLKETAEAKKKE